jgi:hypothetical protein
MAGGPLTPENYTADEVAARFGLAPLEPEGGFFRRTAESDTILPGGRRAWSVIYALFTPEGFSALHRLAADELWFFHMEAALDQPVLVLNRLWQAVNVIGARRAFGLLARGHAQVVHHTEDDFRTFSLMDWIDFSTTIRRSRRSRPCTRQPHDPAAARDPADLFRQAAVQGAEAHAQQRLRARQEPLPVLRPHLRPRAAQPRPRHPAPLRREDDVGEHRLLVHQVQYAQGQPAAARGAHAAHPQAGAPEVAAGHLARARQPHHEMWKDFLDVAYWNVELEE